MKYLPTGKFFGQTDKTFLLDGFTMTDTEYTVEYVDWHYHENPYFTFIVCGGLVEGNRKEIYECAGGNLLFHNWQEPHYNIKPDVFTRGFQLEIKKELCEAFDIDLNKLPSNLNIANPQVKLHFHNIYKETKLFDDFSNIEIEGYLFQILDEISEQLSISESKTPHWLKKADEILHEQNHENISLKTLSKELNLHPVYLCRTFPKFFRCGFGEYIRKIKVDKSLSLLRKKQFSLTEIAFSCGFADQSHFVRCFKEFMKISPKDYRKIVLQ